MKLNRVVAQGARGSNVLVSASEHNVVVNTATNAVRHATGSDMDAAWPAPSRHANVEKARELAVAFVSLDNASSVECQATRAYTVPRAVVASVTAALAGDKTVFNDASVMNAMRLAAGGQVSYSKMQHIGRYFALSNRDAAAEELWGGDAGRKWVASMLRRQTLNLLDLDTEFSLDEADADAFLDEDKLLMGTFNADDPFEIEALLIHDPKTGVTSTWDSGSWHRVGDADWLDSLAGRLVELDGESAAKIASELDVHPGKSVHLATINPEETGLAILAGFDADSWAAVDALTAAGFIRGTDRAGDGVYTSEERKKKAKNQARDKNGKFATEGARGTLQDGRWAEIRGIDPVTGNLLLETDDGKVYSIPSREFEIRPDEDQFKDQPAPAAEPIDSPGGGAIREDTPLTPLDLSRILAQPRALSNAPLAVLAQTLPPLDRAALQRMINEYSVFILEERRRNASRFPVRASGELEKETGTVTQPEPLPVVQGSNSMTPDTADVTPIYIAIVEQDDLTAVKELVALAPASISSSVPATFKRVDGAWVRDDTILADLMSPTPPSTVKLDETLYQSVLAQIDFKPGVTASASVYATQFGPAVLLSAAGVGAGNGARLKVYWTVGEGGIRKIRWNTPGDWTRCYRHLRKYLGPRAKGYCSNLHKAATGVWPGDKKNIGRRG